MKNVKFWNIAETGEDSGEITLYGDVVSRQPTDWWGESEPGLFITPEGFLDDLKAVQGKANITVKLNSCGGDLYTGIAIHNALKAVSGRKTVIVEGIAASAASAIMCAGDDVQVYPGSMVMIHGIKTALSDYVGLTDLKKLQKSIDAGERALAEIYHAKTGIELDKLRSMMERETWMTGAQAVENGFADTLLEEKQVNLVVSADHKTLTAAGIQHDISAFYHIPGSIPVQKKEEKRIMNLEELKAQYPDLTAALCAQAVSAERARLQAIESIEASVADAALVRQAKYGEKACTAEQLAFAAMQKHSALSAKHLTDHAADMRESGAAEVTPSPSSEDDGKEKVNEIVRLYNAAKGGNKA